MPKKKGQHASTIPTSAELLGALVDAFRLVREGDKRNPLSLETARRFLAGKHVKEATRARIVRDVAAQLKVAYQIAWPLDALAVGLLRYMDLWDAVAGRLRSPTARTPPVGEMAPFYVRFVAIDLALRSAALAAIVGRRVDQVPTPFFAFEDGTSRFFQDLVQRIGARWESRSHMANELRVSDSIVDRWFAGDPPSTDNVPDVARYFAARIDGASGAVLEVELRLHYGLTALASRLAPVIGWDAVTEIAAKWNEYRVRAARDVLRVGRREGEAESLLDAGCLSPYARPLLMYLWGCEQHALWQTELHAAGTDWMGWFQHVARHMSALEGAAAQWSEMRKISLAEAREFVRKVMPLALVDPHAAPPPPPRPGSKSIRLTGPPQWKANNRKALAQLAQKRGDLREAIAQVRRAIELQPDDAEAHYFHGAYLGMIGSAKEAIEELWLAVAARRDWDEPWVEIGIVLFNSGRLTEAREHMERVLEELPDTAKTPHFWRALGRVRLESESYMEAKEALDRALSVEPDHAEAVDLAARCEFMLGDRKRGMALAKRARDLGSSWTYDMWRRGEFEAG